METSKTIENENGINVMFTRDELVSFIEVVEGELEFCNTFWMNLAELDENASAED